ncbi:unnamed protein product [Rangifer tarandus platyrhynchus]|uniref:Uncharacterized protein n=1 Tax=Rangifer tarandus platyrhynchus TaxID=3082113 RepID=A0AC60A8H5_RANTA
MTLYLASPITSIWFSLVFHDLDTCEEGQSGVLEKIPLLSDTTEVKCPSQGIVSGVGYHVTHGYDVNYNHLIKGLPPGFSVMRNFFHIQKPVTESSPYPGGM